MNRQNILILILILVLLGGGYYWYFSPAPEEAGVAAVETRPMPVSKDFLALLSTLENIKIDAGFFSSADFGELRGGLKLPPAPLPGRPNPFSSF